MKKTNWRVWALVALAMLALLCGMSENESMTAFVAVKAAGLALGAVTYWLYRRWERAGKIENAELPL